MLCVQICPCILVTLLHCETQFTVISNLGQFNPHFVINLKSSIHSFFKPLAPLTDLTYVYETILSPVVGFDLYKKSKVNNLNNL